MTSIAIGTAAVLVCLIASHAFHSWLRQRERERFSSTDRAALEAKFAELAEWQTKVTQFMANARQR